VSCVNLLNCWEQKWNNITSINPYFKHWKYKWSLIVREEMELRGLELRFSRQWIWNVLPRVNWQKLADVSEKCTAFFFTVEAYLCLLADSMHALLLGTAFLRNVDKRPSEYRCNVLVSKTGVWEQGVENIWIQEDWRELHNEELH
jgi:hypothetical protein